MKNIVAKIILIIMFFPLISISQNTNMDETINYLNKKFGRDCLLDTKNKDLILKFYKNYYLIKEDKVSFFDIDTAKIYYSKEEKAIILKCYGNEKLVMRKIYKANIKRTYSRINIQYDTDSTSTSGVVNAFNHLIRLVQDENYKSDKAFE